jgi:hypothetical protein
LRFFYEGAALLYPASNNGNESKNGRIKEEFTDFRQIPLRQFLLRCIEMVATWSSKSLENPFSFVPLDSGTKHETEAWSGAHENPPKEIHQQQVPDGSTYFCVQSSSCKIPITQFMALYAHPIFDTYTEFKEWLSSWYLVYTGSYGFWTCTCPVGLVSYACKHSTGVRILRLGHPVSEIAKSLPIGMKRARGQPKKVAGQPLVR